MTMTDELMALADRVEALAGPCRETDAEIALTLKIPDWRAQKPWKQTNGWAKPNCARDAWGIFFHDGMGGSPLIPAFTASLDAAMTLVPTRWKLRQMNFSAPCADDRKWHLNLHGGSEGQDCFVGRGFTKEIALTAAALRARAAKEPEA